LSGRFGYDLETAQPPNSRAEHAGQIFLSQATAALLEDEDLGELRLRDLGEPRTRRTQRAVRAYELVVPSAAETTVE
jgi:class 3 adenylate cyclase